MQTENIGKTENTEGAPPVDGASEANRTSFDRFATPPRTEEQKEEDKRHNRIVVGRHERLAVILRIMERVPTDVISFVYRDLARQYHPDKQYGIDAEVADLRTEAFAFITDVHDIWEVNDADFKTLARVKGIIETE